MALPVNIDDLVNHRKVEWARIEYKEGWNPERIAHTICAFSNVMRENGSPPPVFSSPENRDWLSVTLPVNPHFCEMTSEMENPISQRTALKTALKTTPKHGAATCEKMHDTGGCSQESRHVVSVVTAEEELEQIEIALKIALEIAPQKFRVQKSEKIRRRMAQIIQCLLRNSQTTIAELVTTMNVSLRTLRADVLLLRNINVLKRIGADKNGSWVVLLKW